MTTGSGRRTRSCFVHLLGGIAIIALLILSTGNASAADGELLWAKRAGGTVWHSGEGISTFPDGTSVVTGRFNGAVTFGTGEMNETTLVSVKGHDIFIAKYNADGTLAWATRAGGTQGDEGFGISSFTDGSSVVTGKFSGTATFGPYEQNETPLVSAGISDIFIAKYNADGTLAWATRAGGTQGDYGQGISTFFDGTSVVTGEFEGTATFGPNEQNATPLVAVGVSDIFIARYNADGTLAWATRAGGTGEAWSNGISTFPDGTSVVTGGFRGTATFGPNEQNATPLVAVGVSDIFIARYNADGTLAWATSAGGTLDRASGNGISTFPDGTSVVTGQFEGVATFGEGETKETELVSFGGYNIFIARYNADGTLVWAKRAGGAHTYGLGVSSISDGSSVVTGYFYGTAVFGAGEANETTLFPIGGPEIFIARYNTDGTLAWAKRAIGMNGDEGRGISAFPDGSSVVTGVFNITAVFGLGEPNETTLISAGGCNMFVAKYEGSLHPLTLTPWTTFVVGTVASKRTPTPTRTPWPTFVVETVASKRTSTPTPSPTPTQTRTPTPRPTSPPNKTPTPTQAKGKVGLR